MSIETKHDPAKPEPKSAQRRRPDRRWKLAVIGLAGIYVLLAGYDLISNFSEFGMSNVTAASKTVQPAASRASAASPSKAVPAGPAPSAAVSTVSSPASHTLGIASITAFGPEGGSDGDNPGIASRILNAGADKPWYSQWYATPEFGDLRSGTGLLLDMGQTVTVADVRLILGQAPGANVQLRVGDSASLADLTPVASASGAGGTVRLAATTPAQGRYVLLWFIRLPPDGQGHYQVSVYSVSVDG